MWWQDELGLTACRLSALLAIRFLLLWHLSFQKMIHILFQKTFCTHDPLHPLAGATSSIIDSPTQASGLIHGGTLVFQGTRSSGYAYKRKSWPSQRSANILITMHHAWRLCFKTKGAALATRTTFCTSSNQWILQTHVPIHLSLACGLLIAFLLTHSLSPPLTVDWKSSLQGCTLAYKW